MPRRFADSTAPNWVTCPWPPDYLKVLNWQWSEVVAPYWIEHAKFAADHGVKIAIEMHPGFVVYNPETMLKLRRSLDRMSDAILIRVICSGRVSIPSPPCACWWRNLSCPCKRHANLRRRICRAPACSTRSPTR